MNHVITGVSIKFEVGSCLEWSSRLHQQGLKGSFTSYFNLGEIVADISEQSSQHFSLAVGAY